MAILVAIFTKNLPQENKEIEAKKALEGLALEGLNLQELLIMLRKTDNICCFNPQFCSLLGEIGRFLREHIAKLGGTDKLYADC